MISALWFVGGMVTAMIGAAALITYLYIRAWLKGPKRR